MRDANTIGSAWPTATLHRLPLVIGLLLTLLTGTACNRSGGGGESQPDAPSSMRADNVFMSTMTAALSEGQFTVNNPWTQADLDEQNISSLSYWAVVAANGNRPGQVRPYTTLVQQYRAKRKQCEDDAKILNALGEPSCFPTLQSAVLKYNGRYGYYCGKDFPAELGAFWNQMPEPLDGVDYCCRLHDDNAWSIAGYDDECGILMCLSKASGNPATVMASIPDVEEARKYWYDGATSACPRGQLDLPPLVQGP